jgi:hypothetical protein
LKKSTAPKDSKILQHTRPPKTTCQENKSRAGPATSTGRKQYGTKEQNNSQRNVNVAPMREIEARKTRHCGQKPKGIIKMYTKGKLTNNSNIR